MSAAARLLEFASAVRRDGWENAVLGMGGMRDPSAYTGYKQSPPLDDATLEALYIGDHFAARVIEAMPAHALRPGWDLAIGGGTTPVDAARIASAYATREEELDVASHLMSGWCWGRAFGGAITWIGADDGRHPSQPLDEGAIETVRFIRTYDRMDVRIHSYYGSDHPKFGEPESYRITPTSMSAAGGGTIPGIGVVVHESRCVRWGGQPTTARRRQMLQGWDDSVLQRCWEALKQLAEDYGAKSMTLSRVSQAVYRIKGLYGLIAGKQKEILAERMGQLDISRSRGRAIMLDTDEEFVNVTQPLTGLSDVVNTSILRLASAAPMPVTILMGQSPAGMDATGESDLEVWAGTCDEGRTLTLRPCHERIAQVIMMAKDGPTGGVEPEEWAIEYRAIREPTRRELAEIGKMEAEADSINIERGVYSAEAAALRYTPGGGRVQLDDQEVRDAIRRRAELAAQPPKDNAELGTVAPRTTAVLEVVGAVNQRRIPRESGLTILVELHRYTPEVAEGLLGPAGFVPAAEQEPSTPGPDPDPQMGSGAGAPQPID